MVILEELKKVASHPAADELYELVRRRLPRVSLGTVYRNLELLCESGMVRKLEYGGSQRRYDGDATHHYHLRCVSCGRVEDAPIKPVSEIEESLRKMSDYEIIGHHVEFVGICPECKRKAPRTATQTKRALRKEKKHGTERITN